MTDGGPHYRHIEFCRNAETLWHKLQSGHWDWLGVHPKGQFVLGSPRLTGRTLASHSMKILRESVKEGQHGVRWLEWSGVPKVEPSTDWCANEQEAKDRFRQMVEHFENPERSPVLARVWRVENGFVAERRFIAQTPPPNYQ